MRPLAALAVLLLLGPAALAQVPGAPRGPDLEVRSVDVPGQVPIIVDGVLQATPAQVVVSVHNGGAAAVTGYQILYRWVAGGAESPLNGAPAASLDVREERLDPGQTRTHAFDWTLQPGQAGAGAVKAVVQLGGSGQSMVDATPGNNQLGKDVHVGSHGVAVTIDGQGRTIHPGEAIYIRGDVQNLGNVAEPVALQVQLPTGSPLQASIDPPSLVLAAGAASDFLLFLTMPAEDPEPFAHTVVVQATPQVGARRQATAGLVESTFAAYAPDDHVFAVAGGEGTFFASAGRPAQAVFTVRNEGRQQDIYDAAVQAPPGWHLSVAPARFVLDVGAAQAITVTASLAQDAADAAVATLAVASRHPVPSRTASLQLRPSGAAPQVAAVESEQGRIYVGDQMHLRVVLANPGDEAAPAAPLSLRLEGPGTDVRRFVEAPPVPAGASQTLLVDAGPATRGGVLQLEVAWSLGGSPAALHTVLTVREPRLQVTPPTAAQGVPGQEVGYLAGASTFRLRNSGPDAEEWVLRVTSPAGSASLAGSPAIKILAGETRSVAVRQLLPSLDGANATDAPLTLHAALADRPLLQWNATVLTRVVDPIAPSIVVPVQAASWGVGPVLSVRAQVEDLSVIRSAAVLVGSGVLNWSVPMARGADGAWSANVTFRQAGDHVLRVQAVDAAGNTGRSAPWTVDVVPGPRPRLQVPGFPANGSWDVGAPLEVLVEGAQASLVRYQVRQEGRVVAAGNQTVVGGRALLPLDGAAAGEALLHVEAVGDGGQGDLAVLLQLVGGTPGNASAVPGQDGGGGALRRDAPALAPGLAVAALLAAGLRARRRQA